MSKQTTLFLGPEENISILKVIFSSKKISPECIAEVLNKKKGTVNNSIHDLRILKLIDEKMNLIDKARSIVYERNVKQIFKELFITINGNKEAIKEVNSEEQIDSLKVGRIFCFHTNARATKKSSITQIGRLYIRWLKFLDLIENIEKKGGEKYRS